MADLEVRHLLRYISAPGAVVDGLDDDPDILEVRLAWG